ncbi:hypothetical protein ACFX2A_013578 [Malus domestica]
MGADWAAEANWAARADWVAKADWATVVGCSTCGARRCEASARVGFNGTAWAMVVVSWALPRVAVVVATLVVSTMMPHEGGAILLIVVLSLIDRHGPNP